MHVRFSDKAEANLDEIRDYLEPKNPVAFQQLLTRIITNADQLGQFPFLGKEGRVPETRELWIARTPYILVYWIPDEYHVEIINWSASRKVVRVIC